MAARKKKKTTIKLATTKLPGESEQQYVAWLLYCDSGSIDKLLHLWEGLHQGFTETSPDFRALSLKTLRQRFGATSVVLEKISQEKCRQCNGKVSVVLNTFLLLPHIAQYMRKALIQFDIPSSYLYVVVLKKLCL